MNYATTTSTRTLNSALSHHGHLYTELQSENDFKQGDMSNVTRINMSKSDEKLSSPTIIFYTPSTTRALIPDDHSLSHSPERQCITRNLTNKNIVMERRLLQEVHCATHECSGMFSNYLENHAHERRVPLCYYQIPRPRPLVCNDFKIRPTSDM